MKQKERYINVHIACIFTDYLCNDLSKTGNSGYPQEGATVHWKIAMGGDLLSGHPFVPVDYLNSFFF